MTPPNTDIILYRGLPIDRHYENTLYFQNAASQETFFTADAFTLGYAVRSLYPLTYQRVNLNRIKVQITENEAEHINYIAFKNSAYANKWFYAFVDEVIYINDNVYEIVYTIDYIQTYLFSECELLESFIERSHSDTDVAGDNLVPEPFSTATDVGFEYDDHYTVDGIMNPGSHALHDKYALIVFMLPSFNSVSDLTFCSFSNVELAAVNVYGWDDIFSTVSDQYGKTPLQWFKTWILQHQNDADGVIAMYVIPSDLIGGVFHLMTTDTDEPLMIAFYPRIYEHQVTKPGTLDWYTPRNKKLLTYPYSYILASTGETEQLYRYEYFSDAIGVDFQAWFQMSLNPQWLLSPVGYEDQPFISGANSMNINIEHYLAYSRFPMVAFPIDTFQAWLAQTASSNLMNLLSSTLTGAVGGALVGGAAGAVMGGVTGAFRNVTGLVSTGLQKKRESDRSAGQNTGYILNELGAAGFRLVRHSLEGAEAERIDQYFDLYGYAQNKVAVPDLNVRPYWTYVKTAGLQIKGTCPHDALERIRSIFDAGIRFWNAPGDIGNYSSLDNTV